MIVRHLSIYATEHAALSTANVSTIVEEKVR